MDNTVKVDTHSYSSTATGTASVISTRPGESDLGIKASTVTFGARPSNVVFIRVPRDAWVR